MREFVVFWFPMTALVGLTVGVVVRPDPLPTFVFGIGCLIAAGAVSVYQWARYRA